MVRLTEQSVWSKPLQVRVECNYNNQLSSVQNARFCFESTLVRINELVAPIGLFLRDRTRLGRTINRNNYRSVEIKLIDRGCIRCLTVHYDCAGVDLSANQNDVTAHEVFQIEYEEDSDAWHLTTSDGNYWAQGPASTVQVATRDYQARAKFRLDWNSDDGSCSLFVLDQDGQPKSLGARKSGQLYTGGPESIRFYIKFINRTSISLRGINSSGFVGTKCLGSYSSCYMSSTYLSHNP